MNRFLLPILILIWVLICCWWWNCIRKPHCGIHTYSIEKPIIKSAGKLSANESANIFLTDKEKFNLTIPITNYLFAKSDAKANVDSEIKSKLTNLSEYLKKNPNRQLNITGLYLSEEKNTTSNLNLGMARADFIKKFLVNQGIAEKQITTTGKEVNELVFLPDSTKQGLEFSFGEIDNIITIEDLNGINIYFASGSSNMKTDDEIAQFISKAKEFLKENRKKKLELTGHSDNVGEEKMNMELSLKRANFVKEALISQGIEKNQITVKARGEKYPITENKSDEGRSKNRRVHIEVE